MKIAYYMPFKPMGHKVPSGDLVIGTQLYEYLKQCGDDIFQVSGFRSRWIYLKCHLWPLLALAFFKALIRCKKTKPDLWLTYHAYYKAPDLLGPVCCRLLGIPYVIFQGSFATKRKRHWKTAPGFYLNRHSLLSAALVFTNKPRDLKNMRRLIPSHRVKYIQPGIYPETFKYDPQTRAHIRQKLGAGERVVVMTAAMFRPGVKTRGVETVIKACATLKKKGQDLLLIIAGDGQGRNRLERLCAHTLGPDAIFLGCLDRADLVHYFYAADIFAFPGIRESLGMVFLEAQCCGLPVVACGRWGAGEAVLDQVTGFLLPTAGADDMADCLGRLARDLDMGKKMGHAGRRHILEHHDIRKNYARVRTLLVQAAAGNQRG